MAPEKKDMDEPVNVDMKPQDALRLLLADEPSETESDAEEDSAEESGDEVSG